MGPARVTVDNGDGTDTVVDFVAVDGASVSFDGGSGGSVQLSGILGRHDNRVPRPLTKPRPPVWDTICVLLVAVYAFGLLIAYTGVQWCAAGDWARGVAVVLLGFLVGVTGNVLLRRRVNARAAA